MSCQCKMVAILWGNQVVIPKVGCDDMLRELHEAHPGETRMKRLAHMFVWWPGLDHDILNIVLSCREYQNCRPNPPLALLTVQHLYFAGLSYCEIREFGIVRKIISLKILTLQS